jgi:SagB-type dehydrogenase family enzyme
MAASGCAGVPRRRTALAAVGAGLTGLLSPVAHPQTPVKLPWPIIPPTSVRDALARRRSVRSYAPGALTHAELSLLLWAAQGVTSAEGLRTAPSAGALYPLELYVHAARVHGVAQGIHHYQAAAHALQLVAADAPTGALVDAAGGHRAVADASAVVAITAVLARTAAKYGPRADRYVVFECGAAAQNLVLAAVAVGLGSVVIGAFDDRTLAHALALPPGTAPLVLVPIGRPEPR